ncbi:MAG: AraC family transcriptional regulator [Rhodopila sp.]
MERRTVAACFVEEALESLRRHGVPTEPCLAAAGLPLVVTEPVSAERYGVLWLAIAAAIEDEFFGLGGRPMRPGSFALLCHCVLHAGTLERALRRALKFLRVVLDDPRGELIVADGLAQVVLTDATAPRSAFAYRTFWLIVHGITCWMVGRRIPLRLADFRCPAPPHNAEYRQLFGAPVRFGQPLNRLAFDAAFLALPTIRTERMLASFLRGAPANILVRYRYDGGLMMRVRRHLRMVPPVSWPSFEVMAQTLCLPPSTLRQRLRQEGQSYRGIKEEIRRELAVDWLLHSCRGVGKIAAELGFAEPSAFHRAFRKWTSQSPGAFRNGLGDGRPAGGSSTASQ